MTKRYIFYHDPNDTMYLFDIVDVPNSSSPFVTGLLDNYSYSLGLVRSNLSSTDNKKWVKKNFPRP